MNNNVEADIFGIMFHHFSNKKESDTLGSITAHDLEAIIQRFDIDRILPAQEWYERSINRSLVPGNVCLTFDDALRSQLDIALPVLEKYELTAFWFVYSSVFEGIASGFEIYRNFYSNYFLSFDEFFDLFLEEIHAASVIENLSEEREKFSRSDYLAEFDFYSRKEREYRFFRDRVLGADRFSTVMEKMLLERELTHEQLSDGLWMTNDDLVALSRKDHVIGLHSYTHPTDLRSLNYVEQLSEYQKNARHIFKVTGKKPKTVAHPANSYSTETLKFLGTMGVDLGFRSNHNQKSFSSLEYPRADCVSLRI